MLNAYDLYLMPGGEDRGARLLAEAEHERLVASVRAVRSHRRPGLLARLRGRGPTTGRARAQRVPVRP
jgi:hypothetical protein